MADIFLSYSNEDHARVRPLANALQAVGYTVFWDIRIKPGERWDAVIEAELKKARCVVVVWSQRSIASDWVRAEAYEGLSRRVLVPVLVDEVARDIPLAFKLVQAASLVDVVGTSVSTRPAFLQLLERLQELLGPPPARHPVRPESANGSDPPPTARLPGLRRIGFLLPLPLLAVLLAAGLLVRKGNSTESPTLPAPVAPTQQPELTPGVLVPELGTSMDSPLLIMPMPLDEKPQDAGTVAKGIRSAVPTVVTNPYREVIRQAILRHSEQIRTCYEIQLTKHPKLAGKVVVSFVISPEGRVAAPEVVESTVGNAELENCVTDRVRTWRFPKPTGGAAIVVTYPFIFTQKQ